MPRGKEEQGKEKLKLICAQVSSLRERERRRNQVGQEVAGKFGGCPRQQSKVRGVLRATERKQQKKLTT